MISLNLSPSDYNIVSILVEAKLTKSKTEARRVIEQGGVRVDSKTIDDVNYSVLAPATLQKGKLNFLKII